jgi:hypothetical protein
MSLRGLRRVLLARKRAFVVVLNVLKGPDEMQLARVGAGVPEARGTPRGSRRAPQRHAGQRTRRARTPGDVTRRGGVIYRPAADGRNSVPVVGARHKVSFDPWTCSVARRGNASGASASIHVPRVRETPFFHPHGAEQRPAPWRTNSCNFHRTPTVQAQSMAHKTQPVSLHRSHMNTFHSCCGACTRPRTAASEAAESARCGRTSA